MPTAVGNVSPQMVFQQKIRIDRQLDDIRPLITILILFFCRGRSKSRLSIEGQIKKSVERGVDLTSIFYPSILLI